MILTSINPAAHLSDKATGPGPTDAGDMAPSWGRRVTNEKPNAEMSRPRTMNGREYRRIRLRPMRSMRNNAMTVNAKFVAATLSEVSVGTRNPTWVNMVAEKYMRTF
jgi:hypothetical protein